MGLGRSSNPNQSSVLPRDITTSAFKQPITGAFRKDVKCSTDPERGTGVYYDAMLFFFVTAKHRPMMTMSRTPRLMSHGLNITEAVEVPRGTTGLFPLFLPPPPGAHVYKTTVVKTLNFQIKKTNDLKFR